MITIFTFRARCCPPKAWRPLLTAEAELGTILHFFFIDTRFWPATIFSFLWLASKKFVLEYFYYLLDMSQLSTCRNMIRWRWRFSRRTCIIRSFEDEGFAAGPVLSKCSTSAVDGGSGSVNDKKGKNKFSDKQLSPDTHRSRVYLPIFAPDYETLSSKLISLPFWRKFTDG